MLICNRCNECIITDNLVKRYRNNYCKKCFEQLFYICKQCNSVLSVNDFNYKGICSGCFYGKQIYYPGYKPEFSFYKQDKEQDEYIGIELEIQGNKIREFSEIIKDNNFFYCKKDGSLYKGVEIVSHPATFQYHKNNQWKNIFDILTELRIRDTRNCGLHFHVGKKCLSNSDIYNIDYIINNNVCLMEKYGGRCFNSYCNRIRKSIHEWGMINTSYHCSACNLENKSTVEIRFCKSTNDYNIFVERLKFIYSLIQFSKNITNKEVVLIDEKSLEIELNNIMNNL